MRGYLSGVATGCVVLFAGLTVLAADNPPTPQAPGEHSTIVVEKPGGGTESVRDDELAEMIKNAIQNSGNRPSSVKVFFNSCYGGGMLDDIADAMGSFTPPIPFVGASASDADQPAWGPSDGWVGGSGMGSFWTDELASGVGSASSGDNVGSTVGTANANDPTASGGQYAGRLPAGGVPENPQNTSAHGGSTVNWGSGAESVVFSGNNTNTRHGNNVSNMEDAFLDLWGGDPNSNVRSTGDDVNPGTRQGLQDMLNGAAGDIDPGEELVLYVDDHGNTEFDYDEWWDWFMAQPIVLDDMGWRSETPEGLWSELHDGWMLGLGGNESQGDPVEPGINLLADIDEPFPFDSFFDVLFDGVMLEAPEMIFPGEESLILFGPEWPLLTGGPHLLEIMPTELLPYPVPLINLELTSGPVNDLTLPLLGDVNMDSAVNGLDVGPFVDCIIDGFYQPEADMNVDGSVDGLDVGPFVDAVISGGAEPVPEPSALALVVVGLAGLAGYRRRR